jgi:ABC-type transport system involved in multi-copper enzyme maturation permease subunit
VTVVLTVAYLTLFEARRRKIVLAAVVCGLAFLAVFATGVTFLERQYRAGTMPILQHQAMAAFQANMGLWVVNWLTMAAAVLLSVDTLSGEISSGVIETLASKPLRRSEILMGKWGAYWLLTAAYLLLMAGGVVLIVRAITGYVQPNLLRALPLMMLAATVLLTFSIAGGTRLSTITNGIVAFGLYGLAFVGGMVEQIGALVGNDAARQIGTAVSLLTPSDALWRMAAYQLQPAIVRDLQLGAPMILVAAVPTNAMIVWAAGLILIALVFAIRQFNSRAL